MRKTLLSTYHYFGRLAQLFVGLALLSLPLRAQVITTIAGSGSAAIGDGEPATTANLTSPGDVATDGAGNLYITDPTNNRIRKVDSRGIITTVVGTGVVGFSGDGGPAISATLQSPTAIATDNRGNLYVADNTRIRKIDSRGIITTVVGSGTAATNGDGGPATGAMLSSSAGLTVDGAGNLYITEPTRNRIRKVDSRGIITTVAGTGVAGFSGDNGPATLATLNYPQGIAVDSAGTLYIAEFNNNRIRRVDSNGIITTVAGTGAEGYSGDNGQAVSAQISHPRDVALDSRGNLYIADASSCRIRRVDASGIITTIAGNGPGTYGLANFSGDGGPATAAALNRPWALAFDRTGNLFFSDIDNGRIRRIDTNGIINTVAGSGSATFRGDGGPATNAILNAPSATAVDRNGNVFISDRGNNRIRKIDPNGIITTIAGNGLEIPTGTGDGGPALSASVYQPGDLALDSKGNLYVCTGLLVRRITPDGMISTIAGNNSNGYGGDGGPATNATLSNPTGIAIDKADNIFIADSGNQRIRKVDANGIITTVVSDGNPISVAVDENGTLYVGEYSSFRFDMSLRIRKVAPNGTSTTLAASTIGLGGSTSSVGLDGGPAISARINGSTGLAVDKIGNLFFPEGTRIRVIDTSGIINTVAGTGVRGFSGDGGAPVRATLNQIADVTLDANGVAYIADAGNNRIRKASLNLPPTLRRGGITSPLSATVGIPFSASTAYAFSDPESQTLIYGASSLPAGLTINASTGIISGTPTADGTFGISVGATDPGGIVVYAPLNLVVRANPAFNQPPVIVGNGLTSPLSATLGVPVSVSTAYAFSDPESHTLTYAVSGLPAGLSLTTSTGIISGTPTQAGSFPITVGVTDDGGQRAFSSFDLLIQPNTTVNRPPVVVGNGLTSPLSATVGTPFFVSTAYAFSDPESRPLSFSATGLPNGLRIDGSTGIISGTPTQANTVAIIVSATDEGGSTVSSGFILTIQRTSLTNQPPVVVGNGLTSPLSATVGVPFSTSTAYAFSDPEGRALYFTANTLPAGLSLNASTGIIAGTPTTAGTAGILVGATDDGGSTVYSGFILTITRPGGGRLASESATDGKLYVRVLGNPVVTDQAEIAIQGAAGRSVRIRSFDSQGHLLSDSTLEAADVLERNVVPIGQQAGFYYVQVSAGGQQRTVKVLKR